jgi:hypothetical protein
VGEDGIGTTSEHGCHELPALSHRPRRQRIDALVDPMQPALQNALVNGLDRQSLLFQLP